MHIGYQNSQAEYFLQGNTLEKTASEKDFGVVFTNDLKFSKKKKVQRIMGYIKQ